MTTTNKRKRDGSPATTRHFWFSFAEKELAVVGEQVSLDANVTNEEIGLSQRQREKIEKHGLYPTRSDRKNWVIKDSSKRILLVKQCVDVERSKKEWEVNRLLKTKNIPHTIPALCWFESKEQQDSATTCGFLIVPFLVGAVTYGALFYDSTFTLPEDEVYSGIQQLFETFASFDPLNLGNLLRIEYRDFSVEQILYHAKTKQWFLVDFGLVNAKFTDESTNKKVRITMTEARPGIFPLLLIAIDFIRDNGLKYDLVDCLHYLPVSATVYLEAFHQFLKKKKSPCLSSWCKSFIGFQMELMDKTDDNKEQCEQIMAWLDNS
eukprot:Phypoly_transcript_12644.p1 GENE.Phypoly_transcript_12644~~Phypoly_transcript_12644.p1  ORF type:complete len:345 (+),score=33.66 Phypoly_transcript_12644:75-1037(+)